MPGHIYSWLNINFQTFTSKAHNNLQGVFPTMIGFVTFDHLLFIGDCAKRVAKVTKPIMIEKTPLCAFEVKDWNKQLRT